MHYMPMERKLCGKHWMCQREVTIQIKTHAGIARNLGTKQRIAGPKVEDPKGRVQADKEDERRRKKDPTRRRKWALIRTWLTPAITCRLAWNLQDDWLADSETTSHICNDIHSFVNYTPLTESSISGIGNQSIKALRCGTVVLEITEGKKTSIHRLKDTLYIPNAINNLMSISRLDDAGLKAKFCNEEVSFLHKSGAALARGKKVNWLYLMKIWAQTNSERSHITKGSGNTWDSWHLWYGHLGKKGLEWLEKDGIISIDQVSPPLSQCETCIQAKQTHCPHPQKARH